MSPIDWAQGVDEYCLFGAGQVIDMNAGIPN